MDPHPYITLLSLLVAVTAQMLAVFSQAVLLYLLVRRARRADDQADGPYTA